MHPTLRGPGAARQHSDAQAFASGAARADAPAGHWAMAAGVFTVLAIVHTWPLATNPGVLSRNDNGDTQLNEWILAWVAHQLPRNPAGLFDANIFHPAADVLAFSEPLVIPALMAAPLLWLDASPVLAHNLVLLAGFALTGLATYALVVSWTGDRLAGTLAGSLFAFNTHTLMRLAHIQGIHIWGLPLALLFADRVLTRPGPAAALSLGAVMAAMAYTSGYLIVFATLMVGIAALARAPAWRPHPRQSLGALALAACVAAVLVVPLAVPYRRVAVEQNMVRSLEIVRDHSATLEGYLSSAGRIHLATWSGHLLERPMDAFFPGVLAIGLAAVALYAALFRQAEPGRVAMLCAVGASGLVLSLGLQTPVYGWIFSVFPPMQGLRAAARFGNLFLLAMALLAGLGLAWLRRSRPRARLAQPLAIAAIVIVNLEALRAPFDYPRFEGIPGIYRILADEPGPVVLVETPFYPPPAIFENAEYVLNSTAHWRPLMNGYSGHTPESYRQIAWTFWYFPDDAAVAAMREAGVTHVTVHPRRYGGEAAETIARLARHPDLELIAVSAERGIRLYRLR